MRHRVFLSMTLLMLFCPVAAEEPSVPSESRLGYYGHQHQKLHEHGVVRELMRRMGKNCCDGGLGGECRVTQIWQNPNGKWMALLDGMHCPVSVEPITDIPLPSGVFAVVCAAKIPQNATRACPATYCAAAADGS